MILRIKDMGKNGSEDRGNSGKDYPRSTDELKFRNIIEITERDYLYSRCVFRHFFCTKKVTTTILMSLG